MLERVHAYPTSPPLGAVNRSLQIFVSSDGSSVLTTFFTDLRIELRALLTLGRLATFFANFSVKLGSTFLLDRFSPLFANFGVEFRPILLTYSLTTTLSLLRSWFCSTLVVCHSGSRPSEAHTSTFTRHTMR